MVLEKLRRVQSVTVKIGEQRGQAACAAQHHARFVSLWQEADRELQRR